MAKELRGAVERGICPGDEDDEAIHGHGRGLGRGQRAMPVWKGSSARSP